MNVFFVCGAPKSGTTWLQRVLDAHPEVCCSGEGHFVERFSIPTAKVVNEYNQRLEVEANAVYEGRPYYAPLDQNEFDEIVRTFVRNRLRSRGADPAVRWFGDKTPRYTRYLGQLQRLFPEAKFIHIVRDPRDVAVSRMGHARRVGHATALTPGTEQYSIALEGAILTWMEAVTRVDEFAKAHPGQLHELRYDRLHDEPAAETTRLFQFLGVDVEPGLIGRIVEATSFEALTGRKPGEEDPRSFMRKGGSGDWRNYLDEETVRTIHAECGELMRAKGFLLSEAA